MKLSFVRVSLLLLLSLCRPLLAAEPETAFDLQQWTEAAANYESGQSLEPLRRLEEAVRQSVGDPVRQIQVESALLKLIAPETSAEAKKFACVQLGVIGSTTALPAIAKLLSASDTVSFGCLALSTYPPGKADEILRRSLDWARDGARVEIINTLGDRHDSQAVTRLITCVSDANPAVAEAAIAALGKIGTPAAWKAIAKLSPGASPELSAAFDDASLRAAAGWTASGKAKQAKALYESLLAESANPAVRRSALEILLTLDSDQGEKRILEVLSGSDSALKPVAIAAVRRISSPWATEKLAAQVHHLEPEEQALMIESIAERDDAAARLALAKALSSPQVLTRRAAIRALGRLGDPYYASLLARTAAGATDAEETREIETAIVSLKGGDETDQRLVAQLKTALPKARVVLIAALFRRQGNAANPVLLEEAGNSDPSVSKAAFRALAKSGTAADASQMLAKLSAAQEAAVRTEAESAVAQVLARIENRASRSSLVCEALAKAGTPDAKAALIGLLPGCADADAMAALKSAVSDEESTVRDAAARALAEWPDDSARDTLLELYRRSGERSLHAIALRGLIRLATEENEKPGPAVIDHYRQLIAGAKGDSDLRLILGALSGYGHPEALPLALPLLSNPAVRPEAIAAVRIIAEACKAQDPQLAEEALKRLPNP